MREQTGVDRAAFFGSPGLSVDRVEDLQVFSGRAWYAEAKWDGVGDLSTFGNDPTAMVGPNQMQADRQRPRTDGAWTASPGTPRT